MFIIDFFGILLFAIFGLLAYIVWIAFKRFYEGKHDKHENSEFDFRSTRDKPKIGAEVSYAFYDEMKEYCSQHNLSLSDLIRNAVRNYMDTFK